MQIKSLLMTGTIAGIALAGLGTASAASSQSTQEAIRAQQAQIDYLKQQLEVMSAKLQQLQAEQTSVQARAATAVEVAPRVVQSASNKFSLESSDGQYSIGLTGRIHADVGDYINYDAHKGTSPQNLNSGFNLRRARIGVVGKAAGDFTYGFIYDAGGSSDQSPSGIQTAQVGYTGIKNTILEIGYSDTFFTLDEAPGSNDILFLERATPAIVASNVNTGDFRANVGGRYFTDRLWVGAYVTGPQDLNAHAQGESVGAYQRITYQALSEPDYTLHLGVAMDEIIKAPANGGNAPSTTQTIGPDGKTIVTITAPNVASIALSDRPELRIDPSNLLNTGQIGTLGHPVSGGYIANFELAGNYGPLYWQGEYFHYSIDRDGLSTADFDGGYGEASYVLTGESRKYDKASGAYKNPVPAHAFDASQGYWGAWEVGARVSYIDLTSNFTPGLAISTKTPVSQPSAVNGGQQTSFTLGLNWYPNTYMRFMLNYIHAEFTKENSSSSGILGAPIGARMDAIALRTQVAW
jgi:phosphate-selective porin OprO/OprP